MSVLTPILDPDYFAAAFAPPPAWDRPSVSVVPYALAAGEALVRELRTGSASGPLDIAGDTHFRYDGTIGMDALSSNPTLYVVTPLLTGGSAQNARYQDRYQTITGTTKKVKIRFRAAASSARFRISVGDPKAGIRGLKWLTQPLMTFSGLSAGSAYMIVLDFPVAVSRLIQYEASGGTAFGGMAVASNVALTRPAEPANPLKMAFLGDSYSGGAGNPPDGASRMETSPNFIAKLFGATSWINYGIGGTGYIASSEPFINRVPDIVAYAPDILFILGSRNDGNDPAIQAAAAAVLSAATSITTVIVSGPSTSAYVVGNGYVKAATLAAGRTFVDGLAGAWISAADLGDDGVHPRFGSHKKIARGAYAAYKSIDTPTPPAPTGPTAGDDFNRADTAVGLGTSSLGQAWGAAGGGTAGIESNAAYLYNSAVTVVYRNITTASAVGKYDLVIKAAGTGKNARVEFGYGGGNDHNRIGGNGTNWQLERRVTGQTTVVTDLGVPFAAGDIAHWEWADDATLTIKVNGTQVFSAAVPENFTKAVMGLLGNNGTNDCRYDLYTYTP